MALLAVLPGTVAAAPDLQVTFVQANIGGATAGYTFTHSTNPVTITVKNNGPDASPEAVLQLISSDGFSWLGTIPAMASGTQQMVAVTDTTFRTVDGSTVSYTATADPEDLIAEGNEANNAYTNANIKVRFNGYKSKGIYREDASNITTYGTYDINGGIAYSFGSSYYRSGSFGGGWTEYSVTWEGDQPLVPATATVEEVRLYLPYTWDLPDATRGYDMPDNVTVTFNGQAINYQDWSWDRGNFGEWGPYTYGLLTYDVTLLYQKNAVNTLHFEREGFMDKLSLYGMTLLVVYEDPAASRKQIFLNEGFDLLGADYASYKTTEAEAIAYVPFTGMTIDPPSVARADLMTFVPSGDSDEGNLYVNGNLVASNVWNYGATGQPVGEDGSPQVAVDVRDVRAYLSPTGNIAAIQSTAWASQPCMAAAQQFLVVDYGPIAEFSATPVSGGSPLTVSFSDQSVGATAWAWDFDNDGIVDSYDRNPTYVYDTFGIYTVNLTVTSAAGTDYLVKPAYVVVVTPLPGLSNPPTDTNGDGLYDDLNGNGARELSDVVRFFKNILWMKSNQPIPCFDFNGNGNIDLSDVVRLFKDMA
jgi:hypothetical protein